MQHFAQEPVRNMSAKFKLDRLSCFCTGTQVNTTQKTFYNEISLSMKTAKANTI